MYKFLVSKSLNIIECEKAYQVIKQLGIREDVSTAMQNFLDKPQDYDFQVESVYEHRCKTLIQKHVDANAIVSFAPKQLAYESAFKYVNWVFKKMNTDMQKDSEMLTYLIEKGFINEHVMISNFDYKREQIANNLTIWTKQYNGNNLIFGVSQFTQQIILAVYENE
jgi:hypothetical protein